METYVTPDATHLDMHPKIHGGHRGVAKKLKGNKHDQDSQGTGAQGSHQDCRHQHPKPLQSD